MMVDTLSACLFGVIHVDIKIHIEFPGRIVFIGFGSIGQGTLPLVLRHIGIPKERITIITSDDRGRKEAEEYGIKFVKVATYARQLSTRARPAHRPGRFRAQRVGRRFVDRVDQVLLVEGRDVPRHLHRALAGRIYRRHHSARQAHQLRAARRGARAARADIRARPPRCSRTAPTPDWCRTSSRRRCSTSPTTPASTPARRSRARTGASSRASSASR